MAQETLPEEEEKKPAPRKTEKEEMVEGTQEAMGEKSAKNLYLSDEDIDKLKKAGDGSASKGVEKVLAAVGKAGGKVVKAMTPSGEVVKKMPEDVSRTVKGTAKAVGDVAEWQNKYAVQQAKLARARAALYRARGGTGRGGLVNPQQPQMQQYQIQPPGIMGQGNVYAYYEQLRGRNPMLQAINPFNAGGSFSMGGGYSPLARRIGQGMNVFSHPSRQPQQNPLITRISGTASPFTPKRSSNNSNPFGIGKSRVKSNIFSLRRR